MERITNTVLTEEILNRLDLESLCSVACVSTILRSAVVSQVIPSLSSLDLATLSPDGTTLRNRILRRFVELKSVTISCLRLDDSSITCLIRPSLTELHLLSCSSLSSAVLASIGERCPNLRVLTLELAEQVSPHVYKDNLAKLLNGCLYLESLHLKIRGTLLDATAFQSMKIFLPETIRVLKLQPVLESEAVRIVEKFKFSKTLASTASFSIPLSPSLSSTSFTLQSLSLVLDVISDRLLIAITTSLPRLVELDLEDRPEREPLLQHDLTNAGFQSLGACSHLTSLSLKRTWKNRQVSFKRVNDMGVFILFEACRGLESVRLNGFPKISDAGFACVLHSCQNLKRFEVRCALMLSDLAFHDIVGAPCPLVEVKLLSCPLITSEAVKKLASCSSLEILDCGGCKSIADSCLSSLSSLCNLTGLNLAGADITDNGLSALSKVSPRVTRLSLRGCKRVTDRGVSLLLHGGGTMSQTLTYLDLGHMPGISDKAIVTVARSCLELTDLCIRCCFYVTHSSLEALAMKRTLGMDSKQLRRLDIYNCIGLNIESLRLLSKPSFSRLHWIGLGCTLMASRKETLMAEILSERPYVTVCYDGCEMGCNDGWQYHAPACYS